jgi:hypothetical protein
MIEFEQRLLEARPRKLLTADGYEIKYMQLDVMGEFFGYALQNKVYVREGLSDRVEQFVVAHEMYHLKDTSKWLGWFGAETRANIACGLHDPRGLIATIRASLNKRRLTTYLRLFFTRGRQFSD